MKFDRTYMTRKVLAALLFSFVFAQTIDAGMQFDNTPTTESIGWQTESPESKPNQSDNFMIPFAENRTPLYAPPPGGGDGQKLPVSGGVWLLLGLALAYGIIIRRKPKKRSRVKE